MTAPADREASGPELARAALVFALVSGVTVILLGALDALPSVLRGEDRRVHPVPTVQEAERRLRSRLVLPAYFPDTLRWPPALIRVQSSPPAVAMEIQARDGEPRMLLAQSVGADEAPPSQLVPPSPAIGVSTVAVGKLPGKLGRVVGPDGRIWYELSWVTAGHRMVYRSAGSLEELLKMARSAREAP
ncbi:hypothetical protein [Anaeromyxobacter paludicola]|uniref:Transmembrane protein n=1 Tax=Anaeromyxobacter paludicola TaxID=2918171 RepID=A0ABM7X6G5_9BACT|nr:hypothetical protein [Anaeromyxobacter paludicola]BDG07388.1 hypothetical protein AMPC_05010 [Anaeromyxobacter paludicola]